MAGRPSTPKKTAGVWLDTKTGRWRWEVTRKREDGTTFSKNGSRKTKEEAETIHAEVLAMFESGTNSQSVSNQHTVKSWAEYAFEHIWTKPGAMSYNTRRNYIGDIKRQVFKRPDYADLYLKSLTTQHVRKLLAEVGGSQHLQANMRNALARLLEDAQKEGLMDEGRRPTDFDHRCSFREEIR